MAVIAPTVTTSTTTSGSDGMTSRSGSSSLLTMTLEAGETVLARGQARRDASRGLLILTTSRILWRERDSAIQLLISDVKSQAITKPGAPKVKVRLETVLDDIRVLTFEFIATTAHEDARLFVDSLAQIRAELAKTGAVTGPQAALRASVLKSHPRLLELHRSLVQGMVLTDDEFWEAHANELRLEELKKDKQATGMSSEMLSDLRPTSESSTKVNFEMSAEAIEQIYLIHPHVKAAHDAAVPTSLSEKDFWAKFIQGLRQHSGTSSGLGLFASVTEVAKTFTPIDESKTIRAERKRKRASHTVHDLEADFDDELEKQPKRRRAQNEVIDMYNKHSNLVLGGQGGSTSAVAAERDAINEKRGEYASLLRASTELQDLRVPKSPSVIPLILSHEGRFFEGSSRENSRSLTPSVSMGSGSGSGGGPPSPYAVLIEVTKAGTNSILSTLRRRRTEQVDVFLPSRRTARVLEELSRLHAAGRPNASQDALPEATARRLKTLVDTCDEVLRQFWHAVVDPAPRVDVTSTLVRLSRHLGTLRGDIAAFTSQLAKENLTAPSSIGLLDERVQIALKRYDQEKLRANSQPAVVVD